MKFLFIISLLLFASWAFAHDAQGVEIKILHLKEKTVLTLVAHQTDFPTENQAEFIRENLHVQIDNSKWSVPLIEPRSDKTSNKILWESDLPKNAKEIKVTQPFFPNNANHPTMITEIKEGRRTNEYLLGEITHHGHSHSHQIETETPTKIEKKKMNFIPLLAGLTLLLAGFSFMAMIVIKLKQ